MLKERLGMVKSHLKSYLGIYYWKQEWLATEWKIASEQEWKLLSKTSNMVGEINTKKTMV